MQSLILKIAFTFLCVIGTASELCAQTKKGDGKQIRIELTDGNAVDGKLIARRGDTVIVESPTLGILNLNIKNIKNIDAVAPENIKKNKPWFENIHAPNSYFGPTGFNLRKGEGYYSNIFFFFNQVGYGFSDNFSVSAGTELLTLFADIDGSGYDGPALFYANPKFSFQTDKEITIGAGTFLIFTRDGFFDGKTQTLLVPYAIATFGNRNNNLSVGGGAGFGNGNSTPALTLSGQVRLNRGIGLMTENYLSKDGGIGISGFRFMSRGIAFDFGLAYRIGGDSNFNNGSRFPILSNFLGLYVPFGQKKK